MGWLNLVLNDIIWQIEMQDCRGLILNLKSELENIYEKYNTKDHLYSDPIELLYAYDQIKDREIVALLCACLAYGRVAQIKKSVSGVLGKMGPSPYAFLNGSSRSDLNKTFSGFVHRFARTEHLVGLLWGIRQAIIKYGSLQACMMAGYTPACDTIHAALNRFVQTLLKLAPYDPGHLVPLPERGSAGKRLHLFLRWMVRKDAVDPGGWDHICPSKLIVPVDVHMHRICMQLKFTQKKQANLKTAIEITRCFRQIVPEDPVKYDFALTRLGIENIDDDVFKK